MKFPKEQRQVQDQKKVSSHETTTTTTTTTNTNTNNLHESIYKYYYTKLSQKRYDVSFLILLILFEIVLTSSVVLFVKYTNIDWIAYMEQVSIYENGERDYRLVFFLLNKQLRLFSKDYNVFSIFTGED